MDEKLRQEIKEHLGYCPDTGDFWWKLPRAGRKLGSKVGCINPIGYVVIGFNNKIYLAHRLAFICMGEDLPEEVDHINHIRHDNRWCNLRPSCKSTNSMNRFMHKNNSSGLKGVIPVKDKFIAKIRVGGKYIYLGTFKTSKEAHQAYCEAADKYYKEFANYGKIKQRGA